MRYRIMVAAGVVIVLAVAGATVFMFARARSLLLRSPHVAELESPIRGLSRQEVDDLLNGRGAGYARTADLNGVPGPRHVLDLEAPLGLTVEQVVRVQAIYAKMQAEAIELGQAILQREANLSQAFASGSVTEADVQRETDALAALYGRPRALHLRAHLQVAPLLSAEQIARYNHLRGYGAVPGDRPSPEHRHGGGE